MRRLSVVCLTLSALAFGLSQSAASGDDTHPADGDLYIHHHVYGPGRHKHEWYYARRGYYPYYYAGYWVPRAEMRYRHRYTYFGPKYRYYPAWGYGYVEPKADYHRWHR
jgi:hypothetical protein